MGYGEFKETDAIADADILVSGANRIDTPVGLDDNYFSIDRRRRGFECEMSFAHLTILSMVTVKH